MSDKRDFKFSVCRNGDAESALIEYTYQHDLEVTLKNVDPEAVIEKLTPEEIAAHVEWTALLKAIVAHEDGALAEIICIICNEFPMDKVAEHLMEFDDDGVVRNHVLEGISE